MLSYETDTAVRTSTPRAPDWAVRLWRLWSGEVPFRISRLFTMGAFAALFLHAALTVELVYTVRVSHFLFLVATLVGAPFVLSGWRQLPVSLRWAAVALVATYLLATALADTAVLPSQARGSGYRGLVYLADLLFGLAIVGLVAGLWAGTADLKRALWLLVGGASIAAAYGLYQWLAQRFNLPLQDVNNAVNTDGVTRGGGYSQGHGVLGGERIKGTFTEPHYFAMFLASALPLAVGLRMSLVRRARLLSGGIALITFSIVLTSSAPSWVALAGGTVVGLAVFGVSRGMPALAAAAGMALVVGCLMSAIFLTDPSPLSTATGRTSAELSTTTEFRTHTWGRVLRLWATRPVFGFGPGQGPVKLAVRAEAGRAGTPRPPLVLGTAQGLWSASLLDGGVVALCFWGLFLGSCLALGGRALSARPDPLRMGLFVAATTAVIGSQVSGDRLDLRVWVLLGLVAAAGSAAQKETGNDYR